MASLVPWLPRIVEATAEDVARFGPNAARVRALLDFLPTMSDDAASISTRVTDGLRGQQRDLVLESIQPAASAVKRGRQLTRAVDASGGNVDVAAAEVLSDVLSPEAYRTLTNPLAAGRAVDLLRARPRLQGTRFMDIAQQAAERGGITGPRDVVAVSRIAKSPEDIIDIALTLIADGMPVEEAMRTSRMLAQ